MRHFRVASLAACFAAALTGGIVQADLSRNQVATAAPDVFGGYPSTYVMVRVVPGVHPVAVGDAVGLNSFGSPEMDAVFQQFGVTSVTPVVGYEIGDKKLAAQLGLDRWYNVNVPQGTDVRALAVALRQFQQHFELVELDGIGGTADTIPNDTDFAKLWGMHNTGQNSSCGGVGKPDADINAPAAWDIWTGTDSVLLALIDSGMQSHPDFGSKVLVGWNTVTNNTETSDASCPHGTHCAGTAGAIGNNGMGVAGVSWGVKLIPVKVLTGCSGTEQDCGEGIMWAADKGANVGTMSLQYYTGSTFFKDAVAYGHNKGMVLIAATGNNQGNVVAYPAKFPLCMGVGATTNQDVRASFSNYGPEIDVCAPGQDVWSTLNASGYDCYSGTSMATPHVSGLACLLWSYNPGLSNDMIIQALKDNVKDLGPAGFDQEYGWGRIDAAKTLQTNTPGLTIFVVGGTPSLIPPNTASQFNVKVNPGPETLVPGSEKLHYRTAVGPFTTVALANQGGGNYIANLPAFACGDKPEYYVSAESVEGGVKTSPYGAPTNLYSSSVGTIQVTQTYAEGFNSGLPAGWTKTGLWNVGNACPVAPSCDGGQYAYYTQPATCTFNTGGTNSGVLTSGTINLPNVPAGATITLKFCHTLQTENNPSYDKAFVQINGTDIGQCSESPSSWTADVFDITSFKGQQVKVGFKFDTIDGVLNDFRGWQVDGIVIESQEVVCQSACKGDITGDGKTCQDDLGVLLAAYGTCEGDPGYNPAANLATSGGSAKCIDQADLGILLADYGCGNCAP